jgi:hypothetical protein
MQICKLDTERFAARPGIRTEASGTQSLPLALAKNSEGLLDPSLCKSALVPTADYLNYPLNIPKQLL